MPNARVMLVVFASSCVTAPPARVGYAPEAPYAYADPDGRVVGLCPDLARAVLERLGEPEPTFVQTTFARLIPDLQDGRFDVIAAGLFHTPERAEQVRFTRPTFAVGAAMLVRAGDALTNPCAPPPGAAYAVIDGAVEGPALRACGLAAERVLALPDIASGREAVARGDAAGLVLSEPAVRELVRTHPGRFEVAPVNLGQMWSGGPAFHIDDVARARAWNEALADVLSGDAHAEALAAAGLRPPELAE